MTDPTPAGAPIWIDLFTSDADASAAFYGGLFGWSAESSAEHGGYITYSLDGRRVAGGMANDGSSGAPDGWTVYLQTDDAEATTTAARAQGSDAIVEPMAVGDLGSFAVVTDVGGAVIGMWQPGSHTGFEGRAEPGFPGWFELHTRDYEPSLRFYEEVFGWKVHTATDEPGFRYSTLLEGPDGRAGVMDATAFLPEGVPAHWSVYFQVADVDATLARVTELGGAVVMAAEDTPYGRLATATDATGGVFKLMG